MKRERIDQITRLLDDAQVPWRMVLGSRHRKFYIGERLVAIMPLNPTNDCGKGFQNTLAQLRRAIREREASCR